MQEQPAFTRARLITYRWLPWILLTGWMSMIFIFSHQPSLPGLPNNLLDTIFKKLAHASAYAILTSLWWWALRTSLPGLNKSIILAYALTFIYAASDEWHQTFVLGRNGQMVDVLIDMSGALVALLFIRFQTSKSKYRAKSISEM